MTEPMKDDRTQALWEALRRHVCSVCLDAADDGSCGLGGERFCAIDSHLSRVVDAVSQVNSNRMDDYVAAIEREVCTQCLSQDPKGFCASRNRGECALYAYLPLVLDAIEEVQGALIREERA